MTLTRLGRPLGITSPSRRHDCHSGRDCNDHDHPTSSSRLLVENSGVTALEGGKPDDDELGHPAALT
nr:hypothetical protein [Arthrobacter polaris]UIK88304.1 hypothetical protein J0916_13000 [Arthrobacter polaris]